MKLNALLPVTGVLFTACSGMNEVQKAPNVIYVFPDQHRLTAMSLWSEAEFADKVNFVGDPVHTPNLDKFAKEGVLLSDAVSTFPLSGPHRGMLMSGMYPERNGVTLNPMSERPNSDLRDDITTISDVFSGAGYNCAYLGKYHLNYPTKNNPQNPGTYVDERYPAWDAYTPKERRHNFDFWYSYGTFDVHKDPHYWDNDGNRFDPKEYSPKHEVDVAIDYLKNTKGQRDEDKPFFMMISMNPPHSPYASTEDCMEEDYNLYKDKSIDELLIRPNADLAMDKCAATPFYFASVTGVDREFGRLLKALEEMGLDENTIVIYSSDHGETMCSQGVYDAKNSIYTESYNVPFIVRYPNVIEHRVDNLMLQTVDIMPTIIGLAGLSQHIPTSVEGKDLSSILLNAETQVERPERTLYMRNVNGEMIDGKTQGFFADSRGVKTAQYSMAININKNNELVDVLMFDNLNDPYQTTNIDYRTNPTLFKTLCAELAIALKEANDIWYNTNILSELIPYDN